MSRKTMYQSRPLEERFWEKVDKNGPIYPYEPDLGRCWAWTACLSDYGYGQIRESAPGKKQFSAHRLSWKLKNGDIPKDKDVLHRCDRRFCVNPAHLYLGTDQDNSDDRVKRGRQAQKEGNGNAKLTEEQVAEIRRDYVWHSRIQGQPALARKYGVSNAAIWKIVRGENWV